MGKIVVMGSFIQDMSVYTPAFPLDGQSVIAYELKMGLGGKGSNQATAARRFGADTVFIGKVGSDVFAENARAHYREIGIDSRYLFTSEDVSTGVALITIHKERGENRIVVVVGANETLTPEEIDQAEEEIRTADVLLTQFETNAPSVQEFLRLGRKYGKTIIVNPAPMQAMPDDVYQGIDYVTPNETEAAVLAGMDEVKDLDDAREAARRILAKGCKSVLMTLGYHGSFFTDGTREIHVPPIKVKAVDTTGAGDTFNGAFAAAKAEGYDDETAIRYATCMAGLSVTRPGAANSVPTREETEAAYREHMKC